ncbi:MAG: ParA family protein [Candidatus Krumholzibacteriia bacterium]
MRRIVIASAKGGTGKTTTAVSLAHGLALAGRRVVVVDCDPKRHAVVQFGVQPDSGVLALLQGDEAKVTEVRPGLRVIDSGGQALAWFERRMQDNVGSLGALERALHCVQDADYLLLDCPPCLGPLHLNAVAACDEVLLPVATDFLGLEGARQTLAAIRALEPATRVQPRPVRILPTFYEADAPSTAEFERALREEYSGHVLQTRVRLVDELRAAPARQQSVFEYDPLSIGALDYAELTEEIDSLAA